MTRGGRGRTKSFANNSETWNVGVWFGEGEIRTWRRGHRLVGGVMAREAKGEQDQGVGGTICGGGAYVILRVRACKLLGCGWRGPEPRTSKTRLVALKDYYTSLTDVRPRPRFDQSPDLLHS